MNRVNVHIDTLVLNGFRYEDQHAFAAGLQQELARLFTDPQSAQQSTAWRDVARLKVDNIQVDSGSSPHHMGAESARGIIKEMNV